MWYYIDLLKVLQGPFTTAQMKLWLNAGYLPDDLEVRLASETTYVQLKFRKHMIDASYPVVSQEAKAEEKAAPAQQQQQQPAQQQPAAQQQQQQPAAQQPAQQQQQQPAQQAAQQAAQQQKEAAQQPASSSAAAGASSVRGACRRVREET